jgi:hypothetical protein
MAEGGTDLQSISLPEATSVMTKRTQGGGVMGRRSCIQLVRID